MSKSQPKVIGYVGGKAVYEVGGGAPQTEKEILVELGKTFSDYKETNDKRLKEIEDKGHADPLLTEKLNAIEAQMQGLEDLIKEKVELQNRVEDLEAKIARPGIGGSEQVEEEMKNAKIFLATVRHVPLSRVEVSDGDLEDFRNYKDAFLNWVRYGDAISLEQQNALRVGTDPDGGYWVTPDMSGRIAALIFETSPIRQIANVISIGTDSIEGFNDLDELTSGWVGEEEARPETGTPQIGKWKIDIMEQYANPKMTQKLLDDAFINVEGWLEAKIANKLSRVENTAFILGNGILKPRGFLTYPHGTPSKATWEVIEQSPSGADGAFPTAPGGSNALIDMVFSLKADYRANSRFFMARSTVAAVRKLVDGQGNYLWQPDFTALQGARLLGFPIVEGEDMPVIASDSLSIAFGDFNEAYQIVDRIGIRVLRDPFTAKPYVQFYTTKRVGGKMVNFDAIKLMKFATSV